MKGFSFGSGRSTLLSLSLSRTLRFFFASPSSFVCYPSFRSRAARLLVRRRVSWTASLPKALLSGVILLGGRGTVPRVYESVHLVPSHLKAFIVPAVSPCSSFLFLLLTLTVLMTHCQSIPSVFLPRKPSVWPSTLLGFWFCRFPDHCVPSVVSGLTPCPSPTSWTKAKLFLGVFIKSLDDSLRLIPCSTRLPRNYPARQSPLLVRADRFYIPN